MFVWSIDPNLFHLPDFLPGIGGRGIRYYGVIYALVFLGGFHLLQWQFVRSGRSREVAERVLTMGVIAVIGARLGHCLFYEPEKYLSNNPHSLLLGRRPCESSATIALILTLIYFARRRVFHRKMFDRISLSIGLGATLIRLGNFMNSEIVGRVASPDVGVKFPRYEFGHKGATILPCPTTCGRRRQGLASNTPFDSWLRVKLHTWAMRQLIERALEACEPII